MAVEIQGDVFGPDGFRVVAQLWNSDCISAYEVTRQDEYFELQILSLATLQDQISSSDLVKPLESAGAGENFPHISFFGLDDAQLWIAFPTLETKTLDQYMSPEVPLSETEWVALTRNLAKQMNEYAETDLVYGNIVASQVTMTSNGWRLRPAGVGQLGIIGGVHSAKLFNRPINALSPEELDGKSSTKFTDIFSLGSLLAYAGAGASAWGSSQAPTGEIVRAIMAASPMLDGLNAAQVAFIRPLIDLDPLNRKIEIASLGAAITADATSTATLAGAHLRPQIAKPTSVTWGDPNLQEPTSNDLLLVSQKYDTRTRKPLILGAGLAVILLVIIGVIVAMQSSNHGVPVTSDNSGAASEPPPEPDPDPSLLPPPSDAQFVTRVNYSSSSVPDKEYQSLEWTADVCSTDSSLKNASVLAKVKLYKKVGGTWKVQPNAATVLSPGRCGSGKLNVVVKAQALRPTISATTYGKCASYRVVLPETSSFSRTNIDACVQVKMK